MYDTSVNEIKANQVSSRTHAVRAGINLIGSFIGDSTMKCIDEIKGKEKSLEQFEKTYSKQTVCPFLYGLATIEHLEEVEQLQAENKALRKDNGEIAYDFAKENDKLQAENKKLRSFAQFVISSITDTENVGYVFTNSPENLKKAAEQALKANQ